MGIDSTAQIPVNKNVDTDYEILVNAFATGYDALNNIMLTKRPGYFDPTTISEINGRFGILRMLCSRYSPKTMNVVNEMYQIIFKNYKGEINDMQALLAMRNICTQNNINPGFIDEAIERINHAELMKRQSRNNNAMFPFWVQPTQKRVKKRKPPMFHGRFVF